MISNSEPIHPPGTLEQYLPKEKHLGPVDLSGLEIVAKEETSEEKARKQRVQEKPPLDECLSLYDFEVCFRAALRNPSQLSASANFSCLTRLSRNPSSPSAPGRIVSRV